MEREVAIRRRIRLLMAMFVIGLLLSGITAFPLRWEMNNLVALMQRILGDNPGMFAPLLEWSLRVRDGLNDSYARYPFLAYGTDWLAFGHIVIGLAFIGPFRDPVRNVWVVEWAMLACVLVIPAALICGPIRDIPFFHRLIDCSFGVVGIVPLWFIRRWILALQKLECA